MIDSGRLPPDVGSLTIGSFEVDCTALITASEIGKSMRVRSALLVLVIAPSLLLVAGTAWVVRRERARELRTLRQRREDQEIPSGAGEARTELPQLPDDTGGLLREMYRVAGARGEEIVISIRLRPPAPDRTRRRPPRRSRTRPGR